LYGLSVLTAWQRDCSQKIYRKASRMNDILKDYISSGNYGDVAERCIKWIREWFDCNGPESPAVIGISGGKDSSIVAALCCKALGADRVLGVLMPKSNQPDIDYSRRLVEYLGIKSVEINIAAGTDGLLGAIEEKGFELSRQAVVNIQPRIRMATLYAVSQCVNGRVSNNGNRSERYVGYFTKHGDSAGDFAPLANLTVTEVKEVGRALGLPDEFIEKPPSDGLTGKTDEDNIGFTYEALDTYILTGFADAKDKELIDKKHNANVFKLQPMPMFEPRE